VVVLVIDDTELPGSHTMDILLRMNNEFLRILPFECRGMIFWRMTDLEGNFCDTGGLSLL
jgi:hypothetical protein